jgi:NADH dehydrogenase
LDSGIVIDTHTLIWATGVTPQKTASRLEGCEHDGKSGRVVADSYMRLKGYDNVFALGDCAYIPDPNTGQPYPATAQHAIREGKLAAQNIAKSIKGEKQKIEKFNYKTKGMMATVGEKSGVAIIFGIKLHGFAAWWLWRTFYLANLPTIHKKLRVITDWTTDLLFK